MNVGFYLVQGTDPAGYVLADIMIRSVKAAMPGVPITQFTDIKSPPVYGVDHVQRKPADTLARHRSLHYACVEGDWLFLDSDVVVQRDVRDIFHHSFDVAVANRHWTHLAPTPEFTSKMPWNIGVIFSRHAHFWRTIYDVLVDSQELAGSFFGDQQVACALLEGGNWRLHELPGMVYNYPPSGPTDPGIGSAAIVHYKGTRKAWMLPRIHACA